MRFKNKFFAFALGATILTGSVYGMKHYYQHFETTPTGQVVAKPKPPSQKDQIREIIKANLGDIQNCYNQRIGEGLDRIGELKIAWDINEIGLSSDFIEVKNELNDTELFDCSSHAISRWKFPEGIYFKINYTFHLKQKERTIASESNF